MTRYIARAHRPPRAWQFHEYDMTERPSLAVIKADDAPVDTGLLDAHGVPLWRVREPMGSVGRNE